MWEGLTLGQEHDAKAHCRPGDQSHDEGGSWRTTSRGPVNWNWRLCSDEWERQYSTEGWRLLVMLSGEISLRAA